MSVSPLGLNRCATRVAGLACTETPRACSLTLVSVRSHTTATRAVTS